MQTDYADHSKEKLQKETLLAYLQERWLEFATKRFKFCDQPEPNYEWWQYNGMVLAIDRVADDVRNDRIGEKNV